MALRVKVTPINVNYDLILSKSLSPETQSRLFAEFADKVIEDGKAQNARVLGKVPPYTVEVDGRIGAPLTSVKPGGEIFVEYELIFGAVMWIGEMLDRFSPVGKAPKDRHPGLYKRSHVLIADDVEVPDGAVPPVAKKYEWVNLQPYSRKIERGLSPQRPEGVYQSIAQLPETKRKLGNVANVRFGYVTPMFGAIDTWASSPAGAAWARRKRKGNPDRHAEWLRRQPAIIITL